MVGVGDKDEETERASKGGRVWGRDGDNENEMVLLRTCLQDDKCW